MEGDIYFTLYVSPIYCYQFEKIKNQKCMRRVLFLIEKEFKQIFRNAVLLRMMLIAPIMQLILLSLAANFEVKDLKVTIVDSDHSTYSSRLISKFSHIDNFRLYSYVPSYKQAQLQL